MNEIKVFSIVKINNEFNNLNGRSSINVKPFLFCIDDEDICNEEMGDNNYFMTEALRICEEKKNIFVDYHIIDVNNDKLSNDDYTLDIDSYILCHMEGFCNDFSKIFLNFENGFDEYKYNSSELNEDMSSNTNFVKNVYDNIEKKSCITITREKINNKLVYTEFSNQWIYQKLPIKIINMENLLNYLEYCFDQIESY